MGLRILWQDIFPRQFDLEPGFQTLWQESDQVFQKLARSDTEITLSHVEKTGVITYFRYLELLNNVMTIDKIISAESDGYDAVIVGCFADPGLTEARGVVDIPVTGLGESAMLMAQLLGNKFAIVTVGPGWVPIIESNIRRYGFGERTAKSVPVRWFEVQDKMPILFDAFRGKSEELVALFEAEARKCVEDGADVVIAGCSYVGLAFSMAGYREVANTGVPVVDPAGAAIKLAESLADLHHATGLAKSKCATSPYATPPREILYHVRGEFGF